jgi:hypothetical protein
MTSLSLDNTSLASQVMLGRHIVKRPTIRPDMASPLRCLGGSITNEAASF